MSSPSALLSSVDEMVPIVTPEQMRAIDAGSDVPPDQLIDRAGFSVARAAVAMLGGCYGRTVNIVAGPGNNGADGRVAATILRSRGVRVRVFSTEQCPLSLPRADLVIDAAYGTGFRGTWDPPDLGGTPVLAVDIPSGVNAITGQIDGEVLTATRTVTFGAMKFGLLNPPGSDVVGTVELADIGLGISTDINGRPRYAQLVERDDVRALWPVPCSDVHKWRVAVRIVAGSAVMSGAARFAASGSIRAGAGIVHLSAPGSILHLPAEVVQREVPQSDWSEPVLSSLDRFQALVVGPGLGRESHQADQIRRLVVQSPLPTVVDGDGLFALAWNALGPSELLKQRTAPTVLTPHDGEYAMLTGAPPDPDRLVAARRLAADTNSVVLLKGPATVVADPQGRTLVVTSGDVRLATAGSGDVLAGMIGRLLAGGVPPLQAAASAAFVHGAAARRGLRIGFASGDLPLLVAQYLSELL